MYRAKNHNIIKALEQSFISFPIGKQELLKKVEGVEIGIDYNEKVLLSDYCKDINIDYFDNKAQFFCALNASKW
ncbi:hypothetical protein [Microaceticoccus formicicus]|uniref:hypothetical protein n=1 Tax=Microaceticoccus formicicus TaxID=3118105 RepID=UPI003CD03220|nr:hypothetical protein VZL98_09065 [Peptoniphilaceae bacterium AMB_02]